MEVDTTIFLQSLRDILPTLRNYDDARLVKKIGKDRTEESALDLDGYIDSGVNGSLSKNERLALANKLLLCLCRYIQEELNLPVTVKTVVDSMSLLAHATEMNFPGYANCKLLKYTIVPMHKQQLAEASAL